MGKPFTLRFPIGGLDKSKGYSSQPPFTTHSSMNVWPTDWVEGRERGGTRSKLETFASWGGGTPFAWNDCTFAKETGGLHRGIVVAAANGAYINVIHGVVGDTSSGEWKIALDSGTDNTFGYATATMYLQTLYLATGGDAIQWKALGGSNEVVNTKGDLDTHARDGNGDLLYVQPDGSISTVLTTTPYLKGLVPKRCLLVQSHGDRLWIAGDFNNPHIVYASRIGDARDWDYSAVDAGAAWANSGGSQGKISEPITSLFSHKDNECLIVGCTDSYYVVVGNIRAGGRIYSLSKVVGPLMQSALCKVGNDATYFFSRDGLQKIREGCGEPPSPVSRKQLPSDLVGINPGNGDTVGIGYDVLHKGIHIYAKVKQGSDFVRTYWFYDLQSGGFWEMDFNTNLDIAASYPAQMTSSKSGLIAIGSSSHQFEHAKDIDQDSYLWYGPFALGSEHTEGILTEIASDLALTSGEIEYGIYTGDTAESAKNDPNPFVGTWKVRDKETNQAASGLQYKSNPIKRGTMGYLKVTSKDKSSWSVEEIMCVRRQAGRRAVG